MKNVMAVLIVFSALITGSAAWSADAYKIDGVHSSIGFAIRHMMVAKTTGVFNDFTGDILFSPDDLAGSKFDIEIKAASIDTRNEARDNHLRNSDFFEVEKYPSIIFKTKKVEKSGENAYLVTGDLTMKAVTKEVAIPLTVYGPVPNPMTGANGLGIEASFRVNRQDYGVNWNKVLDNGGVAVGNDVDVTVNIEAASLKK